MLKREVKASIFYCYFFPGSRKKIPGKRESAIAGNPGNSRDGKSREQSLVGLAIVTQDANVRIVVRICLTFYIPISPGMVPLTILDAWKGTN